jgi:hypothetical protein
MGNGIARSVVIQFIPADIYQVIKSGLVETPHSGISNTGSWGYPIISGSYLQSEACTIQVTCLSITPSNKDPRNITFSYSIDGGPPSNFMLVAIIKTITKDEKGKDEDIKVISGWSTENLSNGLTITFENLDGRPVSYLPGMRTRGF